MHLAITIWVIIASFKVWNLENFYKFHATLIYVVAMNLLYIFFTTGYFLWKMQSEFGLPAPLIDMFYTFIVFPCSALLFLARYPTCSYKKIYHYLKWIIIYIVVEWIGYLFNQITYDNGWSLLWSLLFLFMMFPMFRLHYKRPLIAYVMTIFSIALIFYLFQVPWTIPAEGRL